MKNIKNGETDTVEFKTIANEEGILGNSFWETVCAFLNTKGGNVFIGVEDDKSIIGVKEKNIRIIKFRETKITSIINNSEKTIIETLFNSIKPISLTYLTQILDIKHKSNF